MSCEFFLFNDTATTEIYTLSLHDALPIFQNTRSARPLVEGSFPVGDHHRPIVPGERDVFERTRRPRSEEHTSELQSLAYLVCRLLLEKKKLTHTSSVDL